MKYAPSGFDQWLLDVGELSVVNGRATYSDDIRRIDEYATWLACYRRNLPAMIGRPYTTGTWRMRTRAPQYTPGMRLQFLAAGIGNITAIVDGNSQTVNVSAGGGVTTTLSEAFWVEMPTTYKLTSSGFRSDLDWSFTVTAGASPANIAVHVVRPIFLRSDGTVTLP